MAKIRGLSNYSTLIDSKNHGGISIYIRNHL